MRAYVLTLVALLALTALTFGLSFAPLGPWGIPVAVAIATAKAVLVALFFMHLLEEGTTARLAAAVAVFLGVLLILLASLDVATRRTIEPPEPVSRTTARTLR